MPMTDDELLGRMQGILDRVNGARAGLPHRIAPASTIDDLGCDSVTTLEIITELEAAAGVAISDEDLLGIRTVGDLIALVRRQQGDDR